MSRHCRRLRVMYRFHKAGVLRPFRRPIFLPGEWHFLYSFKE
ncbi:hypothetical protein C4K04_6218 [Pseudomonas chlororaphis]|uniref:Uncharacterized protein n=1 Tax=Pseudomonas chlororaphis TaxID=587753 RepID=A0A3G7U046_9PSED|nr:hypothetical protein C4K04_6218 [Pseudomonas chlororaphis]